MKSKYLDLTTSDWKAQKQWQHVGLKQERIKLPKAQKIANVVAVINIPFPTCSVVTSPIITKIGQKMSMKEKVKLK